MIDYNTNREIWKKKMIEKGHDPVIQENDTLDVFVVDANNCNGPGCKTCGWSTCWHCNHKIEIPECKEKKT